MDINTWTERYKTDALKTFGQKVWFIGLQGSRGRGEAEETSDIDAVLILESLSADDLERYGNMLDGLPERDKICGFVSGRAELEAWDKAELFQFCNDTVPLYGTLEKVLALVGREDICRAVKTGACGIYHAAVHNFIHERNKDSLKLIYKSAVFVLQAEIYLRDGVFIKKHSRLSGYLPPQERQILQNYFDMKRGGEILFKEFSEAIIDWSSAVIRKTVSF